jgi:hypothetical protein
VNCEPRAVGCHGATPTFKLQGGCFAEAGVGHCQGACSEGQFAFIFLKKEEDWLSMRI